MSITPPWAGAMLAGPGVLVALAVVAYAVIGEPFVGRWLHHRMEQEVAADPRRRTRGYARLLALELGLGAAGLALALLLPGIGARRLGLRLPYPTGPTWLFAVGIGFAVALGGLVLLSLLVIRRLEQPIPVVGGDRVRAMVPRRRGERIWFLGLAAAAGVCEELLYRGLVSALVAALLTSVLGPPSPWVVLLLGALAFGAAHAYQGRTGMLVTALLGGLLGAIYLTTGSLPLVMVLHALLDARVALLPERALGQTTPTPVT